MIIESREVVRWAPIRRDYPQNELSQNIDRSIRWFFKDCLKTVYDDMIDKLIEYTYECWEQKTYSINQYVIFNDIIYKSVENSNTTMPGSSKWIEPDKFDSEFYNEIWHSSLKYILSFKTALNTVTFTTFQAGSKGIGKHKEDDSGFEGANIQEMIAWKKECAEAIAQYSEMFYEDIKDFEIYKNCLGCKSEPKNIVHQRRTMLRYE